MKTVGFTTCIGLRNVLKCLGLELGFRGPANIGIGIGIGIGNLCNIFGIGLGIGILNAYNSEIGIEPYKVIDKINFCTLKNVKQHRLF